jgi:Amidohydrolase family
MLKRPCLTLALAAVVAALPSAQPQLSDAVRGFIKVDAPVAKYLGRDARVGTIAVGKQADLVVLTGDPSTNIADVRNVEIVFKQGVGFDPASLIESVRARRGCGEAHSPRVNAGPR